jgi:hypothetical protein
LGRENTQSAQYETNDSEKTARWKAQIQHGPVAGRLRRFLNLATTVAGRANAKPLGGTFDNGSHRLQVQIPAALGDIVGVADLIAELGTTATHFANSCHYGNLLTTDFLS